MMRKSTRLFSIACASRLLVVLRLSCSTLADLAFSWMFRIVPCFPTSASFRLCIFESLIFTFAFRTLAIDTSTTLRHQQVGLCSLGAERIFHRHLPIDRITMSHLLGHLLLMLVPAFLIHGSRKLIYTILNDGSSELCTRLRTPD